MRDGGKTGWAQRCGLPAAMLAALLACLACAATASAAGRPGADAADRQLQRAMDGLVEAADQPPGAIAVIQRGSDRRVFRAGHSDVRYRSPLHARQRMRIASTSKAFSGAVALTLVERGELTLGTTIGELLPGLPATWGPITLAQLLNHTSGLPDYTQAPAFGAAVTDSPDAGPPPRELIAFAEPEPLRFPPGSDYEYSNSDNIVVGLMVEAATGKSYPRRIRKLVAEPLGLGRTKLAPAPGLRDPFMHGYAVPALADVTAEIDFGTWAWASGGIVSTPANLNRFIRGYAGGALFGGDVAAAQRRFIDGGASDPPGPGRNAAGLALFRYRTNCGTVYGHTGSILGYTQLIAASPDGRRSLTFTITTQAPDELLPALRRAERRAVCAALGRR